MMRCIPCTVGSHECMAPVSISPCECPCRCTCGPPDYAGYDKCRQFGCNPDCPVC